MVKVDWFMFGVYFVIIRNLREMFKLDAADYMMSICGDDGLRELSSPGKSGSIFYLSHDDRFVIKTLNRSELKVPKKLVQTSYSHPYKTIIPLSLVSFESINRIAFFVCRFC